jgi:hypothetical protein
VIEGLGRWLGADDVGFDNMAVERLNSVFLSARQGVLAVTRGEGNMPIYGGTKVFV